jgi:hypothetical protein
MPAKASAQIPEIARGAQHPRGRNWALNVLTSKNPQDIRRELGAVAYSTKTRVAEPEGVLRVLRQLPQRRDTNMADVEVEVGKIL